MMNCTSCKAGKLMPAFLDDLFPCYTCDNCGGNFVMLSQYLVWADNNPDDSVVTNHDSEFKAEETSKAMLCPKTGRLMIKYRISAETDHRVDLSPSINAIWLDKGEWNLFKKEGIAGKLNEVFTDSWQRKIREAKSKETMQAFYENEFGEKYPSISKFREMLEQMPNKSAVIAYLISDNPY